MVAPTVTGISPSSGVIFGGTVVQVSGTGFSVSSPQVTIGGANQGSVIVYSDAALQFTTTSVDVSAIEVGGVDVQVTTTAGTSAANPADEFSYTAPPKNAALYSQYNAFFDQFASYDLFGDWSFTGNVAFFGSVEIAGSFSVQNLSVLGTLDVIGATHLHSSLQVDGAVRLTGIAAGTTSQVLYYDTITGNVTHDVAGASGASWIVGGNPLVASGFLGTTTPQSLQLGTNSLTVVTIDSAQHFTLLSPLINIANSGGAGTIHFGSSNKHMEFDGNSFNVVLSGSIGGIPLAKVNGLTNNGWFMLTGGPLVAGIPAAGTIILSGSTSGQIPGGIDIVSPGDGGVFYSIDLTSGSYASMQRAGLLLARTGSVGPVQYGDATNSVLVMQDQTADPTTVGAGFGMVYVGTDNQLHFLNNTLDYTLTPPVSPNSFWAIGGNSGLADPTVFGTTSPAGINFQVNSLTFLSVSSGHNIFFADAGGGANSLQIGFTGLPVSIFGFTMTISTNDAMIINSNTTLTMTSRNNPFTIDAVNNVLSLGTIGTNGVDIGSAACATTIDMTSFFAPNLPAASGGEQIVMWNPISKQFVHS